MKTLLKNWLLKDELQALETAQGLTKAIMTEVKRIKKETKESLEKKRIELNKKIKQFNKESKEWEEMWKKEFKVHLKEELNKKKKAIQKWLKLDVFIWDTLYFPPNPNRLNSKVVESIVINEEWILVNWDCGYWRDIFKTKKEAYDVEIKYQEKELKKLKKEIK